MDRELLKNELMENLGWSSEYADKFLDGKVAAQAIRGDARYMLALLAELSKLGMPFGEVQISFLVPETEKDNFRARAQNVMATRGGATLNLTDLTQEPEGRMH